MRPRYTPAHPWQPLTDAVNYSNRDGQATTVRLTSATDAATLTVEAGEATELWIISAADPGFVTWRDFHLTAASLAIVAGMRDGGPSDDIDGAPRPGPDAGYSPAIGADEP